MNYFLYIDLKFNIKLLIILVKFFKRRDQLLKENIKK